MALDSKQPLDVLLMTPVQRPFQMKILLETISECLQKAGDEEAHASVQVAADISHEIKSTTHGRGSLHTKQNTTWTERANTPVLVLRTFTALLPRQYVKKLPTKKLT